MRTLVLVPCYRRPEYTKLCIEALESAQLYTHDHFILVDDGSQDETANILKAANLPKTVIEHKTNLGLRTVITEFFHVSKHGAYECLAKIDNDCEVPELWLYKLTDFLKRDVADIVSPNVLPSNAAFKLGQATDIPGFRSSKIVGGLWCMKREMIDGVQFERIETGGIVGAFPVIKQIIVEKDARVGWVTDVEVQDIGHYSGLHPKHIKSKEHLEYSAEVGRPVAWV